MFKIFNIDPSAQEFLHLYGLKNSLELKSHNFERTLAGIGSIEVLDLEKRSSWTHKHKCLVGFTKEINEFFNQNKIIYGKEEYGYDEFSLLKYETGDFFLNHRDTKLPDIIKNNGIKEIHQYTCLIFCPYGENEILEGGELIFKHPDALYEIKFNPGVETKKNNFVMLIFSIDMYHEVLPIIKGIRYVFKKPLFVKTGHNEDEDKYDNDDEEVDDLCDGGLMERFKEPGMFGIIGDY